ncbi:serine hydrolase [Gallaecimonas kandeliae]|uniref:serine hydrolase n=1 Tax=Gallaecimonas kandeliae TaxID=3029055 RepID=UPI002648A432|nr:serine hydrolase [Gallaecimonas kandeliae]WKE64572.1 serine hydrolase [Gallaecimonas kandeliae]
MPLSLPLYALTTALMLAPVDDIGPNAEPQAEQARIQVRMDHFLATLRDSFGVQSGMAIALVEGDRVIYKGNFGYADVEHQVQVDDQTLFYIASITKPLFALTWLQDKGAASLDESLAGLYPGVPFAADIQASQVKVRQLLSHSAGLDEVLLQDAMAVSGLHDRQRRRLMLAKLEPNMQAPLGQFQYTNLGYDLLGDNLAPSWQQAMKKAVFKTLGMDHSTASLSEARRQGWHIARPYSFFSPHPSKALYLEKADSTQHPAGGVFATAGDMARLLEAELNGGKVEGHQGLPAKVVALSQQQQVALDDKHGDFQRSGYALGWFLGQYKGQLTYHHFGSFDGYRPHLSFMPAPKLGMVILDNESELNDKLTDLVADYGYGLMLDEPGLDQRLAGRVAALKKMAFAARDKLLAKEAAYQAQPYQFSLPLGAYLGRYRHPLAGPMEVTSDGRFLLLRWGRVKSLGTASGQPDRLRVKFRPTKGQWLRFDVKGGQVEGLDYDGIHFTKEKAG